MRIMSLHTEIVVRTREVLSLLAPGIKVPSPGPHPRLFLRKNEEEKLRNVIVGGKGVMADAYQVIRRKASGYLEVPPCGRVLSGHRLLSVSREVLKRVSYLSLVYRMEGKAEYADRAIREMMAVTRFPDWNPSHYLDTAEMLLALAVGYDWLFGRLSLRQRRTIRKSILYKGLWPSVGRDFWQKKNNWNNVCCAGIVTGALAIHGEENRMAVAFIRKAFLSNRHSVTDAFRGGCCREGYHYWQYAVSFQALLVSALETACGSDLGLMDGADGFFRSSRTVMMMSTPSGRTFNYSDTPMESECPVAQVWMAARTGDPSVLYPVRRLFRAEEWEKDTEESRLLPWVLLWGNQIHWEELPSPEDRIYQCTGDEPLFVYRSGWNAGEDVYLGVKGGRATDNHGHIDAGSFVFESEGVAWAVDLGKEDYETVERQGISLFDLSQDSDRWSLFRVGKCHNILTLSGIRPSVSARIPILETWDGPDRKGCSLDMTALYGGAMEACRREVFVDGDKTLHVIDHMKAGVEGLDVKWSLCTDAEAVVLGGAVELRKGNRRRVLTIRGVAQTDPFVEAPDLQPFETETPGVRLVGFHIRGIRAGGAETAEVCLRVG